ncbi:MAG: hypothetical protein HYT90_01585 [Candidatus Omnitrophica bacterium]|nr:hypothetical protein [Candidatus Omnitrophota bacterium]
MKGRAPALLILLLIGGVAAGIAAVLFIGQRQQMARLQQQLAMSQQQATQLQAKNQELAGELTDLQDERRGLEQRVVSLRTELTTTLAELDRSRAGGRELQDRFQTVDDERAQLQGRLSDVIRERDEARQRADRLTEEKTVLDRALGRLRERMALLDRDYRRLAEKLAAPAAPIAASHPGVNVIGQYDPQAPAVPAPQPQPQPGPETRPSNASFGMAASVELPPIVVRKDQAGVSAVVRGRLVEVNASHGFVVIDKGSLEGVRAGMGFDVLRGAQRVGRVTAVRVRPQLSACDIVGAKTAGSLQVGDHAVQSGR